MTQELYGVVGVVEGMAIRLPMGPCADPCRPADPNLTAVQFSHWRATPRAAGSAARVRIVFPVFHQSSLPSREVGFYS